MTMLSVAALKVGDGMWMMTLTYQLILTLVQYLQEGMKDTLCPQQREPANLRSVLAMVLLDWSNSDQQSIHYPLQPIGYSWEQEECLPIYLTIVIHKTFIYIHHNVVLHFNEVNCNFWMEKRKYSICGVIIWSVNILKSEGSYPWSLRIQYGIRMASNSPILIYSNDCYAILIIYNL